MAKENKYIRSLVESAQRGNNAALEQLFEMNMGRIYALSIRLMGNKTDAENLTAKVFISAWKNIKSVRVDSFFANWLMSLTVYNALEELRNSDEKKSKKNKAEKPEELKDFEQLSEKLDVDILHLETEQRLALVLNKIEKYTIDEVADLMRISKNDTENHCELAANSLLSLRPELQSAEQLFNKLSSLPKEYSPDKKVSASIYKVVHARRLEEAEKNKAEEEPEEIPEEVIKEQKEERKERKKEKKKKEKKKKRDEPKEFNEKKFKRSFDFSKIKKMILPTILVVAVVASIYYFFFYAKSGLEVLIEKGSVKIDNSIFEDHTVLADGKSITTNEASFATIKFPETGIIELAPVSMIKKIEKKNEMQLIIGTAIIKFQSPKNYLIRASSVQLKEFGANGYSTVVSIDESGDANISVTDGWVTILSRSGNAIIATDYKMDVVNGFGPGVPYHKSASQEMIDLINNVSIKALETSVAPLVDKSTLAEALTLWNLLPRVRPALRELVYQKLYQLVPHVTEISKAELLELDKHKLDLWLEEIIKSIGL